MRNVQLETNPLNILLADDDKDDCFLFSEALKELQLDVNFISVSNGDKLMELLHKDDAPLPGILFLDLNMPRKDGTECLAEIKGDEKLKSIPVVIYSTSVDESIAERLHKAGAHYYICKPVDFDMLKEVIHRAITLVTKEKNIQPSKDKFVLGILK